MVGAIIIQGKKKEKARVIICYVTAWKCSKAYNSPLHCNCKHYGKQKFMARTDILMFSSILGQG